MNQVSWRAALIGALVAAAATLPGLGVGTLWDNSETAYGEVAREILMTHDWVVMHFNGAPWFVQPPLYFWIAAALGKAFGVSELTLRLPSAFASIAMGASVGYVVARVASVRAAIFSTVVLSTGLMQAVLGRLAIMDALLDFCVTAAILAWFAALRTGGARWWVVGCVALGFGMLAKGPVAAVIAVLVIVPWAVWTKRKGGRAVLPSAGRVVWGLVIALAICAPWAIALDRSVGPVAAQELIGHYTFGRYLGTIENQSGPLWYYVPVVILGFFPWFAYLVPAIGYGWRAARAPRHGGLARLALVWAIVPFVFFSFAKTKLPNYVALEFPALAILVALWFDAAIERVDRRALAAWTALVPLTTAGIGFAIWAFSHDNKLGSDLLEIRNDFLALGYVLLAGSLACFWIVARTRAIVAGPFALASASVLVMTIIGVAGEPLVERYKPIPPLATIINRERRPGDAIAVQGVSGGNALLFYTQPRVATIDPADERASTPDSDPRRVICAAARAFVITSKRRPAFDPTYGRIRRALGSSNRDVLYLYEGPACGTVGKL